MKVLIVNLPYKERMIKEGRCEQKADLFQTVYPPLKMAYIAAILRDAVSVRIIDCIAQEYDTNKIKSIYLEEKPELVFVNTTTQTINNDLKIISKLRRMHKAKFVLFGIYASYFRRKLNKKYIIVPADIEEFSFKLAKRKFDKKHLDSLPFPAWDLVDTSKYCLPVIGERFVLLQTATGCANNCLFCTVPFYHGKKLLQRSISSVIKEIVYLKKRGINNILFFADNFTADKKWVNNLCKEIISNKIEIKFICNSRVDNIDEDTLKLMKKAGCWLISFGIESGNQEILNRANKNIGLNDSINAVYWARKAGILTLGNMIIGLPGETIKTIGETIAFADNLKLDFAVFNIATPLPGSMLYEMHKDSHVDFEKLEYSQQVVCKEIDLKYWQKRAYLSFYSKRVPSRFFRITRIVGIKKMPGMIKSAFYLLFNVLLARN